MNRSIYGPLGAAGSSRAATSRRATVIVSRSWSGWCWSASPAAGGRCGAGSHVPRTPVPCSPPARCCPATRPCSSTAARPGTPSWPGRRWNGDPEQPLAWGREADDLLARAQAWTARHPPDRRLLAMPVDQVAGVRVPGPDGDHRA